MLPHVTARPGSFRARGVHPFPGGTRNKYRVARPSRTGGWVPARRDKKLRHAGSTIIEYAGIAIDSAWRDLLSLRDPAGAAHAAGPPRWPALYSMRSRSTVRWRSAETGWPDRPDRAVGSRSDKRLRHAGSGAA